MLSQEASDSLQESRSQCRHMASISSSDGWLPHLILVTHAWWQYSLVLKGMRGPCMLLPVLLQGILGQYTTRWSCSSVAFLEQCCGTVCQTITHNNASAPYASYAVRMSGLFAGQGEGA